MSFASPFWKYHCTGNDFVFKEDSFYLQSLSEEHLAGWIRALCQRRFGIGADGCVLLGKKDDSYSFRYFNADGRQADFCGNALLCVAKHVDKPAKIQLKMSGSFVYPEKEDLYACVLEDPIFPSDYAMHTYTHLYGSWEVHCITVGVKHAVVFGITPSLEALKDLRMQFDANITFVESQGDHLWVKTYEKGVESCTYGCGSASSAIASILYFLHNEKGPFIIRSLGGFLQVHLEEEDQQDKINHITRIRLVGFPQLTCNGFGESYESWNTERSQRSRIPRGAYS